MVIATCTSLSHSHTHTHAECYKSQRDLKGGEKLVRSSYLLGFKFMVAINNVKYLKPDPCLFLST